MKYGCCTAMADYSLLDELGYDYIELAGKAVAAMPEAELEDAAARIARGRVKCCGFNAAIPPEVKIAGPGYDRAAAEGYAKRLAARGGLLGIGAIGVGSPLSRTLPEGFDRALAWRQAREFLTILAEEAGPHGIRVLWESLNPTECNFGISITEGAELVESLGLPNLGIVCDLYHMELCGEGAAELRAVLPWVRHVHAARNLDGKRLYPSEEQRGFYRAVLLPAIRGGYDGVISTEAFDEPTEIGAARALPLFKDIVAEA